MPYPPNAYFLALTDFAGCSIRGFVEKMKCSKTCQNELKTCQNECEYYSEKESASEMP